MAEHSQKPKETYAYSTLKSSSSIRVLEVQDHTSDGMIHLRIRQIDLDDQPCPKYRCISYTWGNPFNQNHPSARLEPTRWEQKHPILLSEPEDEQRRLAWVTTNLYHFLLEFTTETSMRTIPIWIDSLCIDQVGLQERSCQVIMMGRIYSSCIEGLIWLGEEAEETKPVFRMMENLEKIPEHTWSMVDRVWVGLKDEERAQFRALLDEHQVQHCEANRVLTLFFFRSWFHRIWTIQECKLPVTLQLWCGNERVLDFDKLDRLVGVADTFRGQWDRANKTITEQSHYRLISDNEIRPTLHYLRRFVFRNSQQARQESVVTHRRQEHEYLSCLTYTRFKQCSDPRDYVYGLLGLQENPIIQADYTCSVEELYTRVAEQDQGEFFQAREDDSVRKHMDLPSWVPDISCPNVPCVWIDRGGNGVYRAGTVEGESMMPRRTFNRILETEGFEVDTISAIGGTHQQMFDREGLIQSLDLIRNMRTSSTEASGLIEDFWRTTVANLRGTGSEKPSAKVYSPAFSLFCLATLSTYLSRSKNSSVLRSTVESILNDLHKLDPGAYLPSWQELSDAAEDPLRVDVFTNGNSNPYAMSLDYMFELRRFFVTQSGLMGIASQGAQEGDSIVVVKNAQYPFLMRRCASGRYRYLSLAYVHGIMYGESLTSNDFGKIEIE